MASINDWEIVLGIIAGIIFTLIALYVFYTIYYGNQTQLKPLTPMSWWQRSKKTSSSSEDEPFTYEPSESYRSSTALASVWNTEKSDYLTSDERNLLNEIKDMQ